MVLDQFVELCLIARRICLVKLGHQPVSLSPSRRASSARSGCNQPGEVVIGFSCLGCWVKPQISFSASGRPWRPIPQRGGEVPRPFFDLSSSGNELEFLFGDPGLDLVVLGIEPGDIHRISRPQIDRARHADRPCPLRWSRGGPFNRSSTRRFYRVRSLRGHE